MWTQRKRSPPCYRNPLYLCLSGLHEKCSKRSQLRMLQWRGFIEAEVFTNKLSFPHGKPPVWAKMSRAVRPSDWEKWTKTREVAKVQCKTCNGKGVISNACRCHGKGKVLDMEATRLQGIPVMKECGKCSGRGYARLPAENAGKAICSEVMEISQPTWSRSYKPFYEQLITQCHMEESNADAALKSVTR